MGCLSLFSYPGVARDKAMCGQIRLNGTKSKWHQREKNPGFCENVAENSHGLKARCLVALQAGQIFIA